MIAIAGLEPASPPLWEVRNDKGTDRAACVDSGDEAAVRQACIPRWHLQRQSAAALGQNAVIKTPPEPLVWPIVTKLQPGIRSFAGHADTVLDVIGRIGAPPSLMIFTEGNHLTVLSSDEIVGAFPSWAKSQPQYADLDLTNIWSAPLGLDRIRQQF